MHGRGTAVTKQIALSGPRTRLATIEVQLTNHHRSPDHGHPVFLYLQPQFVYIFAVFVDDFDIPILVYTKKSYFSEKKLGWL